MDRWLVMGSRFRLYPNAACSASSTVREPATASDVRLVRRGSSGQNPRGSLRHRAPTMAVWRKLRASFQGYHGGLRSPGAHCRLCCASKRLNQLHNDIELGNDRVTLMNPDTLH